LKLEKQDFNYLTFISNSTSKHDILIDLEYMFSYLIKNQTIKETTLLLYIDGTNTCTFLSGYNSVNNEPIAEYGIWIEFHELWDEEDSNYFDELIVDSLIMFSKSNIFNEFELTSKLLYQTELSEITSLKNNAL